MSTFDSFKVEVDNDEKGLYKVDTEHKKKPLKQKFLTGWLKHGDKIVLVIGIILIGATSFEAGFLRGQKNQKEPIIINQPAGASCRNTENNNNASNTVNPTQNSQTKTENQVATENQKCAFVASKNSNKYHLPTCQWASKIKPENKICFSSAEEAQKRGYQPAKCCIK